MIRKGSFKKMMTRRQEGKICLACSLVGVAKRQLIKEKNLRFKALKNIYN
jgi:hypothetical protein